VGKLLRCVERRAVTVRVRRGGACAGARRDDAEPRRVRANFTFRRVSEVMEGVRLQGMRAAASRTNLQVKSTISYLSVVIKSIYM
jgi:hypothetical protein